MDLDPPAVEDAVDEVGAGAGAEESDMACDVTEEILSRGSFLSRWDEDDGAAGLEMGLVAATVEEEDVGAGEGSWLIFDEEDGARFGVTVAEVGTRLEDDRATFVNLERRLGSL